MILGEKTVEDCDGCRSHAVACFLSIFSLVALWTPDVWLLPLLHAVLSCSDVGLVGRGCLFADRLGPRLAVGPGP